MKPTHKLAMPNGRNKTSDPINISKIRDSNIVFGNDPVFNKII